MYDLESAAWGKQQDDPDHRAQIERTIEKVERVVARPGPLVDLGCGSGAHAIELARRGYEVVGLDGSPRMVEVARARADREEVDAGFGVSDVSDSLCFDDASLGGVLALHVLQHLPHPEAFLAEIRRCLRPRGHLLITTPLRVRRSLRSQKLYWRLRAAFYQRVPGVVRFFDPNSVRQLIEDQGMTVIECSIAPGRISILARA